MDIGMLWIDDGRGRSLASRVREAAASYQQQFGLEPSLCMVHESELPAGTEAIGAIRLETNGRLLPKYFWIGRESELIRK